LSLIGRSVTNHTVIRNFEPVKCQNALGGMRRG
jgi:hypothetical protein